MTGGAPLYRAHEWAGRGAMCFREAAFASHWSEVAKLAWAPPANCGHSSILRAFRLHVMRSMHALDYSPPSGQLKLVYSRRGVAHMNKKGLRRRVLNEEELLVKMAAAYPDVAVTPTDFGGLTIAQQMKHMREARLLVGMHGAGFINLLWMPNEAVVLELFPYRAMITPVRPTAGALYFLAS